MAGEHPRFVISWIEDIGSRLGTSYANYSPALPMRIYTWASGGVPVILPSSLERERDP